MFTGQIAVISNKATWTSEYIEVEDDVDGLVIDLSNPSLNTAIKVYLKDENDRELKTGDLDDGRVFFVGPGFQFRFEDTDLSRICAGTYRCGIKVTINDDVTDLVLGTVAVLEGN